MRSLTGKRVLITGGGRGLGRALAHAFAAAGAAVVVTDLDAAAAAAVAAELPAATAHGLDVTDDAAIAAVRDRVLSDGPLDVLVNNAGVVFGGPFADVPADRHRLTVAVNLGGILAVTHAFLPHLLRRPEALVVNVASASAFIPLPFAASYAASKWAVLGFTESLRAELRAQGHRHVGVTAVCPSYVDTGLFAGAMPPRLTRWLTPEAVAEATVRAVMRRQELVVLPWSARAQLAVGRVLPRPVWRWVAAWAGLDRSMAGWRGHGPAG